MRVAGLLNCTRILWRPIQDDDSTPPCGCGSLQYNKLWVKGFIEQYDQLLGG